MGKALTYSMLNETEKEEYAANLRGCDAQWLQKTVRKIPRKVIMAAITGGGSVVFIGAITCYRGIKNKVYASKTRAYLEQKKIEYQCDSIDWSKFPGSSLLTGEPSRVKGAKEDMKCPICKKGKFVKVAEDSKLATFECDHCHRLGLTALDKLKEIGGEIGSGLVGLGTGVAIFELLEHIDTVMDFIDTLS